MGAGRGKGRGWGRSDDDMLKACAGCCCGSIFIASAIMIACSFSVLSPLEAGISFNTVSKAVDADKVYRNGRYFLGLAKGFLRFPTTYQDIEFSRDPEESDAPPLTTRNSEGQLVIEASLQYRLDLDKLIDIYRKYELNYHDRFVRIVQSAIQTVASEQNSRAFFDNRDEVEILMFNAVQAVLAPENAIVVDFQLRNIELPASVEDQLEKTVQTRESSNTEFKRRQQEVIRGEIAVILEEAQRDIEIRQANRTRESTVILSTALSVGRSLRVNAEGETYTRLRNDIGFDQEELNQYLYTRTLRSNRAGTLTLGFDGTSSAIISS